jgi:hypothetical protein
MTNDHEDEPAPIDFRQDGAPPRQQPVESQVELLLRAIHEGRSVYEIIEEAAQRRAKP